jgi:UrcA family protein
MTRFTPKIPLVAALFGIAAVAASAAFASPVSPPRQVVRYDAAALSTDAGARALYSKLARAAEDVCPSYAPMTSGLVRECRDQAIAAAIAKIGNQRLAELHASRMTKSG